MIRILSRVASCLIIVSFNNNLPSSLLLTSVLSDEVWVQTIHKIVWPAWTEQFLCKGKVGTAVVVVANGADAAVGVIATAAVMVQGTDTAMVQVDSLVALSSSLFGLGNVGNGSVWHRNGNIVMLVIRRKYKWALRGRVELLQRYLAAGVSSLVGWL